MLFLVIAAMGLWLIIFLLPWRPWLVREKWDAPHCDTQANLKSITVLIPARNEEEVIARTLTSVLSQGPELSVIVIDDQSTDTTQNELIKFKDRITIIDGCGAPDGWSGKLWALEQGRKHVTTPLVMLLDADIELATGVIKGLQMLISDLNKDLVSLMAKPNMGTFWERMLMPAFVYFFKLLYPFSLANSKSKYVAAAAGGCIMLKREVLDSIGGFSCIGTALIDDCRLARAVKLAGYQTWLGLTHSIASKRPYRGLTEIWNMVARTAFSQLKNSILLLLLCTVIMALAYLVPILALWSTQQVAIIGSITLFIMHITYLPVLNYYRRSWLWAPTMPLTATMYLLMTWTSAIRYWSGERIRWRGRVTRQQAPSA
jgi:hopene-associated glycosyltransferase HpnB